MKLNSKIKTNGQHRDDLKPGMEVCIVLKQDQKTGILTRGVIKDILTPSKEHHRGIKVRLDLDVPDVLRVGRVQYILDKFNRQICPECNSDLLVIYNNIGVCINCGIFGSIK